MTTQTLLTLSQVAIAMGVIVSALGGYGAYHYKEVLDAEKDALVKPIVDLCHRGITVRDIEPDKLYFDIPYCSGKNANAYNVNLQPAVILRADGGFRLVIGFGDNWPDGTALSYETGKSMHFTISPLSKAVLPQVYIGVRGNFTNQSGASTYHVFDVFKLNTVTGEWVRTLGEEDRSARAFFRSIGG